jgi:DNA-binding LytR/AlgR family response regulator
MPIKIGICDDSIEDIKTLTEALYSYEDSFQISQYADGESLLEDCLQRKILFDIIFLDIYMPGLNGIETAGKIRTMMRDVKIIFVTSSDEHYPEAYDVFALNYLIKPLNQKKLNSVLEQALMDITGGQRQQISFSNKGRVYRIFCRDIQYIESIDKLVCFHMTGGNILQTHAKLDEILGKLPEETFIRCHQSFAVNIFHVDEMSEQRFHIGSEDISISKRYLKVSKDKYFEYLFAHMNRGH